MSPELEAMHAAVTGTHPGPLVRALLAWAESVEASGHRGSVAMPSVVSRDAAAAALETAGARLQGHRAELIAVASAFGVAVPNLDLISEARTAVVTAIRDALHRPGGAQRDLRNPWPLCCEHADCELTPAYDGPCMSGGAPITAEHCVDVPQPQPPEKRAPLVQSAWVVDDGPIEMRGDPGEFADDGATFELRERIRELEAEVERLKAANATRAPAERDEQARQRLVEIALKEAETWPRLSAYEQEFERREVRQMADLRDPSKGSWCAAGLTAAMDQAGLVVPAPGTPARRGAIALLDFLHEQRGATTVAQRSIGKIIVPDDWQTTIAPGDIIAWLQHPPPDQKGWRRGHVAVIVAVDDDSLTTVGWNEGPSPGRVMLRRLWRDAEHEIQVPCIHPQCAGCVRTPRAAETVLWRRPGGLYGIARPVAS